MKPPLLITVNKTTTAADLHQAVTASLRRFLPLPEQSLIDDLNSYSLSEEEGSEEESLYGHSLTDPTEPAIKKFKSLEPYFHIKRSCVRKSFWDPAYEQLPESEEIVFSKFDKICTFWNREAFAEGKFLDKLAAVTLSYLFSTFFPSPHFFFFFSRRPKSIPQWLKQFRWISRSSRLTPLYNSSSRRRGWPKKTRGSALSARKTDRP